MGHVLWNIFLLFLAGLGLPNGGIPGCVPGLHNDFHQKEDSFIFLLKRSTEEQGTSLPRIHLNINLMEPFEERHADKQVRHYWQLYDPAVHPRTKKQQQL